MNSNKALDNFMKTLCEYETDTNNKGSVYPHWYNIIKQDLERLEQLEKENQELKEKNKKWQNLFGCDLCDALGREILLEENAKLKKALDLIKDYLTIANDVPLMTFAERCFTEEEVKLLKEVLEDGK